MRISLLKIREPFTNILIKTIKNYLKDDESINVESKSIISSIKFTLYNYKNIWFGNNYLNFYINSRSPSSLLEVLEKEYLVSNNKLFGPFQWLYVKLAISKIFRVFFSHQIIYITPLPIQLEDSVILGGNHRIRLLFPQKKTSLILLKYSFSESWILNEIEVRSKYNPSYAPKILDYDKEKKYILEEYCPGIPINRLSEEKRNKLIKQATDFHYTELVLPNKEIKDIENWCSSVEIQITDLIFSSVCDSKLRNELEFLIKEIFKEIRIAIKKFDEKVLNISLSHGDFQNANILLTNDKGVKVIDWESTSQRWIGYDLLTLVLETRSKKEIININDFEFIIKNSENFKRYFGDEISFTKDYVSLYFLFYLEELFFQTLNDCERVFYTQGKELRSFCPLLLKEFKNINHL